jgi:hypothetical protein
MLNLTRRSGFVSQKGNWNVATVKDNSTQEVDVAAATRLVAALEEDLSRLSGSSPELQRLRAEVAALKSVLDSPGRPPQGVAEGLHGVRDVFTSVKDEVVADSVKGSQYIAEIGRILGL